MDYKANTHCCCSMKYWRNWCRIRCGAVLPWNKVGGQITVSYYFTMECCICIIKATWCHHIKKENRKSELGGINNFLYLPSSNFLRPQPCLISGTTPSIFLRGNFFDPFFFLWYQTLGKNSNCVNERRSLQKRDFPPRHLVSRYFGK